MKLIVGMLVKNEADRYLSRVIENINLFADELVVLDDQSTDHSMDLIKSLSLVPTTIHTNYYGHFSNEIVLRKNLYAQIIERKPDWFMVIDADEVYSGACRKAFDQLMNQGEIDVWGFRLYDLWDEHHYRADALWQAQEYYTPMLARNIKDFKAVWRETPQHCGRLPQNVWSLRNSGTDLMKIKHLGWIRVADRLRKYERYMANDPEGKYGSLEQYKSILDPCPFLVRWVD